MEKLIIKLVLYAASICAIIGLSLKVKNLNVELSNSINNEKAFIAENSSLIEKNRVFKLTIDQLEYFNDSLMLEMKRVATDNGVKERKISALQYQLEHYYKRDTIIVRDTIFKDPGFILDTCMSDYWNRTCLHLEYPGSISIDHEYRNDKYVTISIKKEPIKPRKWFLPRWFTRKHKVAEILVVDKNPYVTTPEQRYIEIID